MTVCVTRSVGGVGLLFTWYSLSSAAEAQDLEFEPTKPRYWYRNGGGIAWFAGE